MRQSVLSSAARPIFCCSAESLCSNRIHNYKSARIPETTRHRQPQDASQRSQGRLMTQKLRPHRHRLSCPVFSR
uniref:Secreted protein n=1 Tax=Panagrellus redivivus TaxID=6233 RepID=A0A7E4UUZ9_PANRE